MTDKTMEEKIEAIRMFDYDSIPFYRVKRKFHELVNELLSSTRSQALSEAIARLEGKKYTFHDVDWGDGIVSKEPIEDETVCCSKAEGYNQAIDDAITELQKLKGTPND